MRHLVALILGCLLVAQASTSTLETLQTQMAISGSHLSGANFQVMILLPRGLAQTLSDLHLSQLEVTEAAHVVDAVSAFTEEYRSQGGKTSNLDIVVKHPEALGFVRERGLSFYTKSMTDAPLRFSRKSRDVVILPYKSIQSCTQAAQIGVVFEQNDESTFVIRTASNEYIVSRANFEKSLLPFFTEACSFVELARHQAVTKEKTGLVFEFASLEALTSSSLAAEAPEIIKRLTAKFEEEAQKVFGETGVATHVVFLEHSKVIRQQSARILAETAVTADVNDDYMRTIKYVFSIVFTILLLIICINMYTMDIYKDSLIYAKFLVKKNN